MQAGSLGSFNDFFIRGSLNFTIFDILPRKRIKSGYKINQELLLRKLKGNLTRNKEIYVLT